MNVISEKMSRKEVGKIQLSFICPTKYIPTLGAQGDFTLALAHLLNEDCDNEYAKALKKAGLPIILDNSVFELGTPENALSLLNKAEMIGARIVFAPDYLYNRGRTSVALQEMINLRNEHSVNVEIGAVCQADNADDYISFYKELVRNEQIKLIGLSILAIPRAFKAETGTDSISLNRIHAIRELNKLKKKKDSHLLGLGDSLIDVEYAAAHAPWIVSHDSSSAFMCGLLERSYKSPAVPGGKPKQKVDFELSMLTPKQGAHIRNNISFIKKYVSEV